MNLMCITEKRRVTFPRPLDCITCLRGALDLGKSLGISENNSCVNKVSKLFISHSTTTFSSSTRTRHYSTIHFTTTFSSTTFDILPLNGEKLKIFLAAGRDASSSGDSNSPNASLAYL